MKRIVLLLLPVILLVATTVHGDAEGMATAHVYVVVDPNVTVGVMTATVNAGTVQTGDFTATIQFRVDANKESICLSAAASPLFKGDDPTGAEVPPIPLNMSAGILIAPTNANPLANGNSTASYTSEAVDIDGFPGIGTEAICYESSQNGHFSQDVFVTVTWNQDDPEKPTGEYSGKVKLLALLLPGTPD